MSEKGLETGDALYAAHAAAQDRAVTDEFETIFLSHYEAVYRMAYRIAGTREEAEDLSQEAFLRLHAARELWDASYGQQHNIGGWLYRVVTHLALNAVRGEGRRQRREGAVYATDVAKGVAEGNDPAVQTLRAGEREAVRRALLRLPERQAQLLLLRYAGLSYRELAETLRIAPGSVGTMLARAEAAFEQAYGDVEQDQK